MLTIQQILDIAKISLWLALNDISKGVMYGGKLDPLLGRKIYMEYQSLEWMYAESPSDTTLRTVANYVYELCGSYALQAQVILNIGNTGGTVMPPSPYVAPSPIEFVVSAVSYIPIGGNTVILPVTWSNYNLLFIKNNIPQSTVDNGGTYYTWDKTTRVFTCVGDALEDDLFQLIPII